MPKTKNKKGKKRTQNNNAGSSSVRAPSNSATAYWGPISAPPPSRDAIVTFARGYNVITSNMATGLISPIYTSADPFNLSLTSFTEFAATYRQYRVLGLKVQFSPILQGATNNVLLAGNTFMHGSVRKASSAPTAYADVLSDSDARQTPINMSWSHGVRALSPDEMLYTSTGSAPTNIFAIEAFGGPYALNTDYGSTLVLYLIQFSDRYK